MSLHLSPPELVAIASCSETMVRPFDYPSPDAWRLAVLDAVAGLVPLDAAFFNFRLPPPCTRVALSREFTGELLDDYERLCVNDAGYERAMQRQLFVTSQRAVVGEGLDEYYADPAVCGFYLPNKLLDSLVMFAEDRAFGVAASIEMHTERYGTAPFGQRGVALVSLLLPALRAGLTTISRSTGANGDLGEVLNASAGALQAFDARGVCVHQTPAVTALLVDDPQRDEVLEGMARLARVAAAWFGPLKTREYRATCPCAADLQTAAATYHMQATAVSSFPTCGRVILVALERRTPLPVADAVLVSRYSLTPREILVARALARSTPAKEIASELAISVHTVRRHSEQIFMKLGVHTRGGVATSLFRA